MSREPGLVGQQFAAILAFEWLYARMGSVVSLQIAFAAKSFAALFAHKRLVLQMYVRVLVELRLGYETLGAHLALEGPVGVLVDPFDVIVERRLIEEFEPAVGAPVGVVVAMRQHMGLPRVLPPEEFATDVTLEVFGRAMSSVMTPESCLTVPKRATDLALQALRVLLSIQIT
jgi:hypothetical protein